MRFRERGDPSAPVVGGGAWAAALLALLAYVPALASSPGRMPADTKLYLYLDPGGLLGRAASTFEADQFAGWVPHQQITYLWPSGPWFWLFDVAGIPDWVAHRLWIGTILFAAGAGVFRLARRLDLVPAAALAAGVVYQTSPYLLAYVSRTSVLLLPWAGLGWIVALTVRASRLDPDAPRLRRWGEPAAIALIVATIGSANATALVLIAPAPLLWLVHVAIRDRARRRALVAFAARTAVLCTGASLWWVAMLVVQTRHGAPVLAYSETLGDVSRNSTGSEVVRQLGYWLFYVRDAVAPTTSASTPYLISSRAIAVSYAVTLAGLVGIAVTRWRDRSFAASLAVVGAVLAVGVHPIGSPSPLMSLLVGDDESGIALALRSSTRALPMLVLALALGAGALVAALPAHVAVLGRWTWRTAGAVLVVGLALLNLPALWQLELVDPAIDRASSVPPAWERAAGELDDRPDGYRVLQVPGAEFGAFDWGYTVDQPLVALTDRPLVTRDLLPLGSAAAMDLLYALDDRIQAGVLEPDAVAPVSRLFGADVVWLAGDLDALRFATASPAVVDRLLTALDADGLGAFQRFGDPPGPVSGPLVDAAALHARGAPAPSAVALVDVERPVPIVRAKSAVTILSGSGDGVVDAASAGLLSGGELIRYSASLSADERIAAIASADAIVVTDSNRDRAHHWRSSQDVVGHTESGGPDDDVLVATAADRRLEVFAREDPDAQTIAIQRGPVTAIASGYGEPFAYRPEDRAVMAIDGDLDTAWRVADHGDPVGATIRLVPDAPVDGIVLFQVPPPPGGRAITQVTIRVGDRAAERLTLGAASTSDDGQRVALAAAAGDPIDIRIDGVTPTSGTSRASRAGVGFREIDLGIGATTELIRPPVDALRALTSIDSDMPPIAIALTRHRVAATDPWRSDPEPTLARLLPISRSLAVDVVATLRLDARATDRSIAAALGLGPTAIADRRLLGSTAHLGAAAVDGDATTAWTTPFDDVVGASLDVPLAGPVGDLGIVQPIGDHSSITAVELAAGGDTVVVDVPPPDPAGRSIIELPQPLAGDTLRLTIVAVEPHTAIERRYGDPIVLPAAIAELEAAGSIETRRIGGARTVEQRCATDLLMIDGQSVPLSFTTTVDDLLAGKPVAATLCDGPVELAAGDHDVRAPGAGVLTVDRVVLRTEQPPTTDATIPVDVRGSVGRTATVTCPAGCWFVLGEGYNPAWQAAVGDRTLGRPALVDGGFNGWWLAPSDSPRTIEVRWTAQRPVTIGLALSALVVVLCAGLIVAGRRGRAVPGPERSAQPVVTLGAAPAVASSRPPVVPIAVLALGGAILIGPVWAVLGLAAGGLRWAAGAIAAATGRRRIALLGRFETIGVAVAAAVAVAVLVIERRDAPLPTAGWTLFVDHLNGWALFSLLLLAVGTIGDPQVSRGASARTGTGTRTAADAS